MSNQITDGSVVLGGFVGHELPTKPSHYYYVWQDNNRMNVQVANGQLIPKGFCRKQGVTDTQWAANRAALLVINNPTVANTPLRIRRRPQKFNYLM